ncbi:hypothetical protein BU26DRAFT_90557 [Trematosphaeria pertusa]|uniref:Arylsulfotransferase n=1 Tax=Trematosphaeria pertusa TaxID=390896 RepID=A0A6A6I3D0_9PLEO|nr:uncharacterized protein BU26DRAFT_90557 [Trematosphaeria pertusa]KAF2244995.1 hypothetical protein BU26DRAFT_90557 [Trematosphaeria pertusa]
MFSGFLRLPKSLLVCLVLQDFGRVLGDTPPFLNDQKFENGEYGAYPMQRFYSSNAVAPRLNILSTHSSCDDGSYTMFNPRGNAVPDEARGPMILDSRGNMVWTVTGYEQTYDLMVQEHKGKRYLTFWSGNDAIGGHGNGQYIMMDTSYKEVARLKAANGLEADLHEFRFTGTGTALITIYDVQQADLTQLGGSSHGYIWDSVFQEIDIETGELVFQWRASEHFAVTDSFHPRGNGGSKGNPWDWFHINSIEKDPWGNYLVSARYTSTVSYINGSTGELIWVLGGRPNQFFDLSEGRATDFKYQHDARWHENYTVISIFANGARAPGQQENTPYSSALKIRIDTSNTTRMTAQLDTQFINTLQISSSSQGSTQVLPNGNALVGYGYNAAFTEFASNGVALCETHFGATSRFHTGDVQSYRVLKFNWTGTPDTDPSLAVVSDSVFVSWNGATEVVGWVLETGEKRSGSEDIEWQVAAQNPKTSFETEIQLPEDRGSYIRVVAVDAEGRSLGITKVIQIAQTSVTISVEHGGYNSWKEVKNSRALRFTVFCITLICFGVTFSWLMNAIRRWWKDRKYNGYVEVPMQEV